MDYDWLIIGSGFGGSVSALRLSEKGYTVGVIEAGRRFEDEDFAKSSWQLSRYLWAPLLGLRGIMCLTPFKDVFIASGSGVGGGSIVYANTLYRAKDEFFRNPQWAGLADWQQELEQPYATAEYMLGVNTVPFESPGDKLLQDYAASIGTEETFCRTPVAVFFGEPGETVSDPFFDGEVGDRANVAQRLIVMKLTVTIDVDDASDERAEHIAVSIECDLSVLSIDGTGVTGATVNLYRRSRASVGIDLKLFGRTSARVVDYRSTVEINISIREDKHMSVDLEVGVRVQFHAGEVIDRWVFLCTAR